MSYEYVDKTFLIIYHSPLLHNYEKQREQAWKEMKRTLIKDLKIEEGI